MQTTRQFLKSHIDTHAEMSADAYSKAYEAVVDAMKLYAVSNNMSEEWLHEMLMKLEEAFIELKASIYFEEKVHNWVMHTNSRLQRLTGAYKSFSAGVSRIPVQKTQFLYLNDKRSLLTHE